MTDDARVPTLAELDPNLVEHLKAVAGGFVRGEVVPVLGAGANLCDRKAGGKWVEGRNLPNGSELSQWLVEEYDLKPDPDNPSKESAYATLDHTDLLKVSQYADLTSGERSLYNKLSEVFLPDYPIPSLHRFLAKHTPHPQLIVSTNYDDLMERALGEANVEYDLVRYLANGRDAGKFVHRTPDGEETVIDRPNTYVAANPEERTVVLKIHGTIVRGQKLQDSYVITEDHYIEYLSRANPSELIPATVLEALVNGSLLFLGYGMRDWNLRVMLHQILELRAGVGCPAWAVQHKVETFEGKLWSRRGVELHQYLLSDYVGGLELVLKAAAERAAEKAARKKAEAEAAALEEAALDEAIT